MTRQAEGYRSSGRFIRGPEPLDGLGPPGPPPRDGRRRGAVNGRSGPGSRRTRGRSGLTGTPRKSSGSESHTSASSLASARRGVTGRCRGWTCARGSSCTPTGSCRRAHFTPTVAVDDSDQPGPGPIPPPVNDSGLTGTPLPPRSDQPDPDQGPLPNYVWSWEGGGPASNPASRSHSDRGSAVPRSTKTSRGCPPGGTGWGRRRSGWRFWGMTLGSSAMLRNGPLRPQGGGGRRGVWVDGGVTGTD